MLKKIAATAVAFAGIALFGPASADDGWWDNEDDYRQSDYDRDRDVREYDYQDTIRDDGYVYAEVIDAEPVYRFIRVRRPQRECWEQEVYHQPRRRYHDTAGATVAGGLIGGVIGRQLGDGKGRDAMTVVGTLIGSAIAHDNADRRNYRGDYYSRPQVRTVERCATNYQSHEERRLDGYDVTYIYAGRQYTTRTARDPGNRIRVRVAVTPAQSGRY